MTAMGVIEGVKRTLYQDEISNEHVYPLDEKINLQIIGGNRSRYTHVFSHNAAQLYAKLTEEDSVKTLEQLLGIKIEKASLATVAQAVAEEYISKSTKQETVETPSLTEQETIITTVETVEAPSLTEQGTIITFEGNQRCENGGESVSMSQRLQELDASSEQETVEAPSLTEQGTITTFVDNMRCENGGETVSLAQRLQELDERSDRDKVIRDALDGKLEGVECGEASKIALYGLLDGTGIPGLKKELSANGKNGGGAKTFEAKIGSVFRQGFSEGCIPLLNGGEIYRQPYSTKYIGTVGKVDQFTQQFTEFAIKHGIYRYTDVVFIGDGAHWIWNLLKKLYPNAICIIDFFHAAENLNKIVDALRLSAKKREKIREECHHLLELGEIGKLELLIKSKSNSSNAESIDKGLAYFTDNADKMRYGLFRAAGLFIGSGVIEAACKTIVGKRMKNAGMHWSKKNAEGVIALRCAIYSDEFDLFDSNPIAA